jgi:hypothetical protein
LLLKEKKEIMPKRNSPYFYCYFL